MMYTGKRIEGDGRGKVLGFPTLNLSLPVNVSLPEKTGVFVVRVEMDDCEYFGLLHLGPRPTFQSDEFRIEIFLFSFHKATEVGTRVSFEMLQKIREVITFDTPKKLVAQIERDRVMGKAYVEKYVKERM